MSELEAANLTDGGCSQPDQVYLSIRAFQKVAIPLICILGTVGNLLATGVFVSKVFRHKSCILYLSSKCVVDTIFLISLFVVWLNRVGVGLFHHHGICQMIIFITYIFGFLSVWFVVCVTLENYIRIARHHMVQTLCTLETAKGVLLVLGLFSIGIYNFPLWTTGITVINGTSQCSLLPQYTQLNQGLTYADTVLTLALPCLLILVLLVAIVANVYEGYRRQQRLRRLGRHGRSFFHSPQGRVARMLLAVSIIFFIFHTPSHAIRLRLMIVSFTHPELPIGELKMQRVFEMLYYVNFSTNCLTYFAFGKTFRQAFVAMYCRCLLTGRSRASLHNTLNSVIMADNPSEKETEMIVMQSTDNLPHNGSATSDPVCSV